MHTNTDTQTGPVKQHRWLIAAPLFALCVIVSSITFEAETAAVIPQQRMAIEGEGITLSGSQVVLNGSAMIASQQLVRINADEYVLTFWNGVADATYAHKQLSIAALTAPVLIQRGSGTWIVPAGMQISLSDTLTMNPLPLPAHYLQDKLPLAQRLLATLSPVQQDALSTVALMTESNDLHMLASLHPLVRDEAWVLTDQSDLRTLRLLPASDTQQDAVSALAIERWGNAWNAVLKTEENPAEVIAEALPALLQIIEQLQDAGYPERAQRYAEALATAMSWYRDVLPAETQTVLAQIEDNAAGHSAPQAIVPQLNVDVIEASSSSSAAPLDSTTALELVNQTRAALQAQGGMFTKKTSLSALDAKRVAVANVVFASNAGDKELSFTFHPLTNDVSAIQKDGRVLPNSLTLEKFIAWVRG